MQPRAEPGTRLDNRYRLADLLRRAGPDTTFWRATDDVLGRPVAVRIVAGLSDPQCAELIAAATRAGQVPDARWVRVLDVGSTPDGALLTAWVVSEWVEGPSLAALVRHDPLRGAVATWLGLACAQAVAAAEQHGTRHGALHPDEVLVPADGNPRLTGLEISTALQPAQRHDDTVGVGGLLYAALTGRWPLPGWDGLPAPTRGDGRHPRQQRGGVGGDLDAITATALSGGYPDAAALVRALTPLPAAPLSAAAPEREHPTRARLGRVAWRVVPPALVVAVGVGAWTLGSDLGRVPSPARVVAPSFPEPRQSVGTTARQVVWSSPPHISSFDPEGDGTEDPGGVGLAVDDDPSTSWTTDTYVGSPEFGGLKHGVGLLLDLGRAKTVDVADLLLSAPGADVQLRAGMVAPREAADLPVVGSRQDSPASLRLTLSRPVRARYWLVWFTSLPKAGSGYRLGVAEVALLG